MAEKRKSSEVWSYFTSSENKNATCNICKRLISYKISISNLKSHLKRVHPIHFTKSAQLNESSVCNTDQLDQACTTTTEIENAPSTSHAAQCDTDMSQQSQTHNLKAAKDSDLPSISQSLKTTSSNKYCTKASQKNITSYIQSKLRPDEKNKLDKSLMNLFTQDLQPFSIVEDKGFKQFVNDLNPSYSLPSRKVVSNTMLQNRFQECLEVTKQFISNEAIQVCITTDCWTSCNAESYIAVTCHFLTKAFEHKSVLLECALILGSHTGENLASEIKRILQEWSLNDKVALGVSDNVSNIKMAFERYLHLNHIGCYAHSFNLIVQSALEISESTFNKIKRIVLHFKKSRKLTEKFILYQLRNNVLQPKRLIQSVPTRWNSIFFMLKRFVELKDCVCATLAIIDVNLPLISAEEWEVCSELCEILEPFEEVTRAISGENYLTGGMPIVLTHALVTVCNHLKEQPFMDISRLIVKRLASGLETRFGNLEENENLTLCTFLEPRFKHHYFSEEAILIKQKVHDLIEGEIDIPCNESTLMPTQTDHQSSPPAKKKNTFSVASC